MVVTPNLKSSYLLLEELVPYSTKLKDTLEEILSLTLVVTTVLDTVTDSVLILPSKITHIWDLISQLTVDASTVQPEDKM